MKVSLFVCLKEELFLNGVFAKGKLTVIYKSSLGLYKFNFAILQLISTATIDLLAQLVEHSVINRRFGFNSQINHHLIENVSIIKEGKESNG